MRPHKGPVNIPTRAMGKVGREAELGCEKEKPFKTVLAGAVSPLPLADARQCGMLWGTLQPARVQCSMHAHTHTKYLHTRVHSLTRVHTQHIHTRVHPLMHTCALTYILTCICALHTYTITSTRAHAHTRIHVLSCTHRTHTHTLT